eukprot:CAMPEP_0115109158 /NCGR_PEP_ID=MMETSP0227-20121206/38482_1 /TAXON_ID=89957 /ORGANISM="Polarella glacialis, Strain CCMP 1383" /LENGTH=33 /DNA_ID= /DNA_START= /DNA_END= /DNA_ORIENTATION=
MPWQAVLGGLSQGSSLLATHFFLPPLSSPSLRS